MSVCLIFIVGSTTNGIGSGYPGGAVGGGTGGISPGFPSDFKTKTQPSVAMTSTRGQLHVHVYMYVRVYYIILLKTAHSWIPYTCTCTSMYM